MTDIHVLAINLTEDCASTNLFAFLQCMFSIQEFYLSQVFVCDAMYIQFLKINHVNATKSYLHFGHFAPKMSYCFQVSCFLRIVLISDLNCVFICIFKCKRKHVFFFFFFPKCQLQPSCIHMTKCAL